MTEASLSAKVVADITDFKQKFEDLNKVVRDVAKAPAAMASATVSATADIEKSTGQWKGAFIAVGAAAVASALKISDTIGEWTRAAAAATEKIEHVSLQTGIAAQTVESWRVAIGRAGGDTQQFATAFRELSKDIEKARGEAEFSKTKFAEMGLSLKDLGNTETVIRAIADRLTTISDPAERARLAVDVLGKSALSLIPVLRGGSDMLDDAAKKSQHFGLVLSDTARSQLLTFDDAMDDLVLAVDGFKTAVAQAFAPSLTSIVNATTESVVTLRNVFNGFATAAETLYIRLGAVTASIQLLGKQLFSTSALSKEAWQQTLEQIKAIDTWAASEIAATRATAASGIELKKSIESHAQATKGVGEHVAAQQKLGEQIVKNTQLQMRWKDEMDRVRGASQQRQGEAIVSGTQTQISWEDELNKRYLARQKMYEDLETAAFDLDAAEKARNELAIARNEEYQGAFLRTQHIAAYEASLAAQNTTTAWGAAVDLITQSSITAFGMIRASFGNAVAGMIMGTATFQQFMQQVFSTMINAAVQLGINLMAQWLATTTFGTAVHKAMETAKTAATATGEAARLGISLATNKAMLASTTMAIAAMGAVGNAAMGVMGAALVGVVGFLMAVAAAVAGIPYVGQALAGAIIVGATMASVSGTAAIVAATAALNTALGVATVTATTALATPFASGGIVRGSTFANIGEAGPEAAIPLNSRGASFMASMMGLDGGRRPTTIVVELDGQPILKHVVNNMPDMWKLKGLPA